MREAITAIFAAISLNFFGVIFSKIGAVFDDKMGTVTKFLRASWIHAHYHARVVKNKRPLSYLKQRGLAICINLK